MDNEKPILRTMFDQYRQRHLTRKIQDELTSKIRGGQLPPGEFGPSVGKCLELIDANRDGVLKAANLDTSVAWAVATLLSPITTEGDAHTLDVGVQAIPEPPRSPKKRGRRPGPAVWPDFPERYRKAYERVYNRSRYDGESHPSVRDVATELGIDRKTLPIWVDESGLTFPPKPP